MYVNVFTYPSYYLLEKIILALSGVAILSVTFAGFLQKALWILLGEVILKSVGISTLYLPLLYVDVVGVSLQVVLLGILNVLFYLDQRRAVVGLTLLLLVSNVLFTAISLRLGAPWFGYGFALAMLVSVLAGVWVLNRKLERLEYQTFMLQ